MSLRLRLRQYASLLAASVASFLLGSYFTVYLNIAATRPHHDAHQRKLTEQDHFAASDDIVPRFRQPLGPQAPKGKVEPGPPAWDKAQSHLLPSNKSRCYAISRGYPFFLIQPFEDELSVQHCSQYQEVMFRKHCVAALYLDQVDWLYVLDADTTVINADHCLEDFIDPQTELMFYERYFSAEVMSGNYIARSTAGAKRFLREWAGIEREQPPMPYFFSSDNGAIHLQVLRLMYPDRPKLIAKCFAMVRLSEWPDWEPGYGAFIRCAKKAMIQWNEVNKGRRKAYVRVRMLPRAQAFCRDIYDTWYQWYDGDFMAHSVKTEEPFNVVMTERLTLLWDGNTPPECQRPDWAPTLDEKLGMPHPLGEDGGAVHCGHDRAPHSPLGRQHSARVPAPRLGPHTRREAGYAPSTR